MDARYDLFAEHHEDDRARVQALVTALAADGLSIWFEPWSVPEGAPIQFSRIDGAERSDALLAFVSAAALGAGLERRVTLFQAVEGRRPVLLVLLDDAALPPSFADLPRVDQRSDAPDPAALAAAVRALGPADFSEVWSGRRDTGSIWALAAPGRLLVSLSQHGMLRGWARGEGRPRWETRVHAGDDVRAYGLAVSERGIVATSSYSGAEVRVLGLRSRETLRTFALPPSYDLAWLDDGDTLAAATEDGVLIVDAASGTVVRSLGDDAAYRVAVTADRIFAADSFRGTRGMVRGWTRDGRATHRLRADDSPVRSISVQPGGRLLAAGGEDGRIRLWDLRTTTVRRLWEGHTTRVEALAWRSDRELVSASWDRTLRGWDPARPRSVRRAMVGGTALSLVAVDDRAVAVGMGNGTVSLRRADGG